MTLPTVSGFRPIEDYAIIGDCRSAALVSKAGSIDWLCWPCFDSASVFCGLLDCERGGVFAIAPAGAYESHRRYVGDTAVLETTFETTVASFTLTDCMPIACPEDLSGRLYPEHELVRVLTCVRGEDEIAIRYEPRTGFAQWNDRLVDRGKLGIRATTRRGLLNLRTDAAMTVTEDGRSASARQRLRAGESIRVSLTWSSEGPAVMAPLESGTGEAIARSLKLWQEWSGRTTYEGRHRDLIVRSAITVRLLTYAPSGATIAAATTSLPERRGGKNNWDYRYCWLRDASFTVRGMLALGHADEAVSFTHWLLHATRLTQPKLRVLYDVYGRAPPPETSLPGLSGYEGALPVQTGNGADGQIQMDCYGEIVEAVWRVTRNGHALSGVGARVLESLGLYVCRHWREPDAGIWEPRGDAESHVHSLALCWAALDRLLDLQDRGDLRKRHRVLFEEHREKIRVAIEQRGYNKERGSYVSTLDGDRLDATALLLGWYGFDDPDSARMRSTYAKLVEELSPQPGLMFRYDSKEDDGAFGICSFWMAEHLARGGGTLDEARAAFEATLAYVNDVGLFAEEFEPGTGASLGNTPQVFTHVGFINAALSLQEREQREGVSIS